MFRFFQFLLSKGKYESCKACEVYKNQIEIVNHEKQEMLKTLLSLVNPIVTEVRPRTTDIEPIAPRVGSWSRARARLEEQQRQIAIQKGKSPHLARPDNELRNKLEENVRKLEAELGIDKDLESVPEEKKEEAVNE